MLELRNKTNRKQTKQKERREKKTINNNISDPSTKNNSFKSLKPECPQPPPRLPRDPQHFILEAGTRTPSPSKVFNYQASQHLSCAHHKPCFAQVTGSHGASTNSHKSLQFGRSPGTGRAAVAKSYRVQRAAAGHSSQSWGWRDTNDD